MSSIAQRINGFGVQSPIERGLLEGLWDLIASLRQGPMASAGLAINGAGNAQFKTVNTIDVLVSSRVPGGQPQTTIVSLPSTASGALAGTILQNNFGGWAYYVNAAGNVITQFLNQAATLAGVTFPATPAGYALVGYVRLNPTTAAFIGATTALDAANTNAVYSNCIGCFDPSSSLFAV